jgi:cbb3-type cytochrome oxidase subunit 3
MRLSEIMSHAGLAGYAVVALVIFVIVFVAILIRVLSPSRKREYDEAGRMPLDDEHPVHPREKGKP